MLRIGMKDRKTRSIFDIVEDRDPKNQASIKVPVRIFGSHHSHAAYLSIFRWARTCCATETSHAGENSTIVPALHVHDRCLGNTFIMRAWIRASVRADRWPAATIIQVCYSGSNPVALALAGTNGRLAAQPRSELGALDDSTVILEMHFTNARTNERTHTRTHARMHQFTGTFRNADSRSGLM